MSHEAASVSRMKNPANAFGECIAGVDGSFDVLKDDMSSAFPVLDGEVLNVDVSGAFSGAPGIDHFDCGFVVFV